MRFTGVDKLGGLFAICCSIERDLTRRLGERSRRKRGEARGSKLARRRSVRIKDSADEMY